MTVHHRNGNVSEYSAGANGHHVRTRVLTRGVRPGEPLFHEAVSTFYAEGQLRTRTFLEGNRIELAYQA